MLRLSNLPSARNGSRIESKERRPAISEAIQSGGQGLETLADQIFDPEARGRPGRLAFGEVTLDVFCENVDFEVHGIAGGEIGDVGVPEGIRDDGDFGDIRLILPIGDGQANAIDGDGAFTDDVRREFGGNLDAEIPGVALRCEVHDAADFVHVAKDEVAAEFFACGKRLFEVDSGARLKERKRRFGESFPRQVGRKVFVVAMDYGEAATVDGDARGHCELGGESRRVDGDFAAGA